jgi:formylglycine-generating enzyme required for sulfatase activity
MSGTEGVTYRLPTEAEWEYACRAGSAGPFAGRLDELGWYVRNSGGRLHPVRKLKPNRWGLYDMHGNVAEWCEDYFGTYPDELRTAVDPRGAAFNVHRVIRGGSAQEDWPACRAACRAARDPRSGGRGIGFRVVRELPPLGPAAHPAVTRR